MLLLHRCQLLCLPEQCTLSCKNLASPSRAGWKILLWAWKRFLFPTATSWQGLCSDMQILSLRSHGQELSGHSEQNVSLKASSSSECTSVCSTTEVFGGAEVSSRISFEAAFKAPMTCGQRHMQASQVLFLPSIKFDRTPWVWGEGGGWRAEECLHFLSCH